MAPQHLPRAAWAPEDDPAASADARGELVAEEGEVKDRPEEVRAQLRRYLLQLLPQPLLPHGRELAGVFDVLLRWPPLRREIARMLHLRHRQSCPGLPWRVGGTWRVDRTAATELRVLAVLAKPSGDGGLQEQRERAAASRHAGGGAMWRALQHRRGPPRS